MSRRTGLIIYDSLDVVSGGYLYDRQLASVLCRRGWDVRIFSLPWRSYPRHLLDNLRARLVQEIEQADLDLLIEDELNHPSLIVLNQILRSRLRCPIVSIVHHLRVSEDHPAWQRWCYERVERAYLNSVDAFVFNSQATAESVGRLVPGQLRAVVAYPAGDRFGALLEASEVRSRALSAPPLRLVFLGNVIPRKGLSTLIEALGLLPGGGWSLSIVGDLQADSRLTRRLRDRVRRQGLLDSVHFVGKLSDDALAITLRESHVLVVPSIYEGFGIAYLEGMRAGLPAIGTKQGGAGEIIAPGLNGWLIDPGDAAELSLHLLHLIRDRQSLVKMSLAALERGVAHPTWDESMTAAAEFLEGVTRDRRYSIGAARLPHDR